MKCHGKVCVVSNDMVTPVARCVVVPCKGEVALLDMPSHIGFAEDVFGAVFECVLAHGEEYFITEMSFGAVFPWGW